MQDLMEISYEIAKKNKTAIAQQKEFTEKLRSELGKEKSADIAPHLECTFDIIKQEYVVTLRLPVDSNIFNSSSGNVK